MKKVLITLIATFAFCGSIFAQQYESHWPDFNMYAYEDHTDLYARVQIDGDFVGTDNYEAMEVAAFVDGELRGATFMHSGDPVYVMARIYINYRSDINKVATFKLYDHANNYEYDVYTSDRVIEAFPENIFEYQDLNNPVILSFFHAYYKEITPYTGAGGYYFIASPVGEVLAKDVENLMSNNYDFYSFNQQENLEWINHRGDETYALQPGMGYLYANSGDGTNNPVVLTFIGAPYDGDGDVDLVYDADAEFPGWNLVGNPFAQAASIERAFYTLNGDGSEVIAGEGYTVDAMEGIFVIAADANDNSMTFSPTDPEQSKGQIVLNVNQDRGDVIDRAIVRFGGDMLPKFTLNPESTKLYISKDHGDFAVVCSNKSGKLPVNFKAAQDGVYTISVNVENLNNLRYLHLIDKLVGNDVDLFQNPSYRFEAKTKDEANRFMLVFESEIFKELFISREDDNFSFCNNGNWIINNEGEAILQVVDVEGRILSSEEINGSVSKHIEAAPGVYMLRLINGKDMKVQKIVVE